jgi:hypothetical protein
MKQIVLFVAIIVMAAAVPVVYGDKSAIQPTVTLDLYGTGFGVSAMGHRANSSGFENVERWDYTLFYKNALFDGESYATQYMLGWVYYNYPDLRSEWADLQEIHAVLSWPEILPVEGLVPTYILVKLWPSSGGSLVASSLDLTTLTPSSGTASGFAHIFMLDYALPVEDLLPDVPEQILRLHAELVYNDGVGPAGQDVDSDWSNAVVGVATDFELAEGVTLTPGIYYQVSMDKSVNEDKDEMWATVGVKYEF